jgi:hypothetical protein
VTMRRFRAFLKTAGRLRTEASMKANYHVALFSK